MICSYDNTQEGFARFCTERYSTDPAQLSNRFVHLTNSSIQKERQYAKHQLPAPCRADGVAGGPEFHEGGTKCSLGRLFHFLKVKHGIDRDALWARITETCLRALFVAQDVIPHAVRRSFLSLSALTLAHTSGRRRLGAVVHSVRLSSRSMPSWSPYCGDAHC